MKLFEKYYDFQAPTSFGFLAKSGRSTAPVPVVFTAENKEGSTIFAGMAVAQDASGSGIVLANAGVNGRNCIGLMLTTTLAGVSGPVVTFGNITLSDWTLIVGSVNLVARTRYYLDVNSGKLVSSSTDVPGNVSQLVARSISPTTLEIIFGYAILL